MGAGCLTFESGDNMTTYREVNAAWPDPCPIPTPQEAIRGVKRLIRRVHRIAIDDGAAPNYLRLPKRRFKITSGRRITWPRKGVWYVNPNERRGGGQGGWAEIVHSVSHWAQRHYWPRENPHGPRHVWIEKELTDYAVKNLVGGQLKRPEKAKADPVEMRSARVGAAIKRWEAKKRRAETALRKLRKQERYYGRRHTGVPAARVAADAADDRDAPALAA
jgi:hypothetical protein